MSKSRGEKGGKTPNANQNTSAVSPNAIIPGKLFENDWLHLVDEEDGDDFISDIIDEIVCSASDRVFDNIIASRVQPYAVICVKKLLEQILEARFIECDAGESSKQIIEQWCEDEEPSPMATDSWAQGAVPVTVVDQLENNVDTSNVVDNVKQDEVNSDHVIEEDNVSTVVANEDTTYTEEAKQLSITVEENIQDTLNPKIESPKDDNAIQKASSPKKKSAIATVTTPALEKKRVKKFKQHNGSLPKFQPISLTSVIDESNSYKTMESDVKNDVVGNRSLKTRYLVPKDAVFDENGNLVHVSKINTNKLHANRVKTKFRVEDPINNTSKKNQLMTRKNKQIEQHKRLAAEKETLRKNLLKTEPLLQRLYDSTDAVNCSLYTPLPPSIVDTIDIQRGVSIKEGGLSRQGPKKVNNHGNRHESSTQQKDRLLQCLGTSSTQVLKVDDIVSNTSIRSLNDNKPLPSIKT